MAPALLCETVTAATMAELIAARDAADAGDMVELRLDGVAGANVAQALHGRRRPVIVTCRPAWEGGRFDGSEAHRLTQLAQALERGAEYVDVEWQAVQGAAGAGGFDELIRKSPDRVIVSSHDFDGVPKDLQERARAMRSAGAGVIKVAVTARRLSDTLPLIDIARDGDAVVIGMGDAGVPSRLLASRFASRWTYAGNGVAPGQIPARRMVEQFRFRDVGPNTAIYGVVGVDAVDSILPVMHNAAFAAAGIDAVCVPLPAAEFDDVLTFAHAMGIAATNVTEPCEVDAPKAAGDTTPDSLPMLIAQAERQFERWTGRRPPAGVMRSVVGGSKEQDPPYTAVRRPGLAL